MNIVLKHKFGITTFLLTSLALLPMNFGCENTRETVDNLDSRVVCAKYYAKQSDCDGSEPSDDEKSACVDTCRDSIENDCGNENQAAADDKIGECVDKSCVEFSACMVFETAPDWAVGKIKGLLEVPVKRLDDYITSMFYILNRFRFIAPWRLRGSEFVGV